MAPVLTEGVSISAKVLKDKDVVVIAMNVADDERKLRANASLYIGRVYAIVRPPVKAFSPI